MILALVLFLGMEVLVAVPKFDKRLPRWVFNMTLVAIVACGAAGLGLKLSEIKPTPEWTSTFVEPTEYECTRRCETTTDGDRCHLRCSRL